MHNEMESFIIVTEAIKDHTETSEMKSTVSEIKDLFR